PSHSDLRGLRGVRCDEPIAPCRATPPVDRRRRVTRPSTRAFFAVESGGTPGTCGRGEARSLPFSALKRDASSRPPEVFWTRFVHGGLACCLRIVVSISARHRNRQAERMRLGVPNALRAFPQA